MVWPLNDPAFPALVIRAVSGMFVVPAFNVIDPMSGFAPLYRVTVPLFDRGTEPFDVLERLTVVLPLHDT
jgi:hypothetical protein